MSKFQIRDAQNRPVAYVLGRGNKELMMDTLPEAVALMGNLTVLLAEDTPGCHGNNILPLQVTVVFDEVEQLVARN